MSNPKLTEMREKVVHLFQSEKVTPFDAIFCMLSLYVSGCIACKVNQGDAIDLLRETYIQIEALKPAKKPEQEKTSIKQLL